MIALVWFCVLAFSSFAFADDGIVEPEINGNHLAKNYSEPGDQASQQIVGGLRADIRNYPYQIQLLYSNSIRCGGSILSKNYVITAAHCTVGLTANQLSIRAGSSTRSGGVIRQVLSKTEHPNFNQNTLDYDVSILHLSSPLTYGSGIDSISLATSVPPTNTQMTVTGWGRIFYLGPPSTTLRVVRVPMYDFNRCSRRYTLTERMICAGRVGRDSCNGDSGGPMVYNGRLVGIVSFGIGCGFPAYPGVYASVPAVHSWIVENVVFD